MSHTRYSIINDRRKRYSAGATAAERLQRDRYQAQQAAEALQQALRTWGSQKLGRRDRRRLRSQQKLSKIVGVMFPPSLAVVLNSTMPCTGLG